jgi:hypothetical protein
MFKKVPQFKITVLGYTRPANAHRSQRVPVTMFLTSIEWAHGDGYHVKKFGYDTDQKKACPLTEQMAKQVVRQLVDKWHVVNPQIVPYETQLTQLMPVASVEPTSLSA